MVSLLVVAACARPADDRSALDFEVGLAEAGGVRFEVADHLAAVRAIAPGELALWSQAPSLRIEIDADAPGTWTLDILNALPDAELSGAPATRLPGPRPTALRFEVELPAGATTLVLRAPDADDLSPWRVGWVADIQDGVDRFGDLVDRMNQDPSLRFVLGGGDLVHRGDPDEYTAVLDHFARLNVPFYTTQGNHELWQDDATWQHLFGVRNLHFDYRGVHVTLVDSSNATLDPSVYDRLDGWLAAGAGSLHLFGTHIPPFDPVGARNGSFRSRHEAAKLYAALADAGVDLVLLGHIHSYYAFNVAGIPSYIAGGGGASPTERLDGIGRHYLAIDLDPTAQTVQVGLVLIDD